ncbi:ceramide kinase-like [Salvia splendens]|uniref:ceramide kinase-like n=1 Tax=Salvia splendens TaxID=180675 RepID=UPI001C2724E6|nr:ceramide kinase-like [Salvia splendens]
MLSSITNRELNLYDGVVAVGGDGFFNEILNGVLLSRHKAPYPPTPSDITPPAESECNVTNHNVNRTRSEHCDHNEDGSPLLRGSENIGLESPNFGKDSESLFPNEMFRFGLIPAGSIDAIVIWYIQFYILSHDSFSLRHMEVGFIVSQIVDMAAPWRYGMAFCGGNAIGTWRCHSTAI